MTMPRGAWLALGALGAALVTTLVAPVWSAPIGIASLTAIPVAVLLAWRQRARQAALLVGIASIGLRVAIGSLTASVSVPPPSVAKEGVWTAQVLTLGTTDGGK